MYNTVIALWGNDSCYSSGTITICTYALAEPCLRLFSSSLGSFRPEFLILFQYYSCVCFFLFFQHCCSYARGILYRIRTSCIGSPFPAVCTKLSLVLQDEALLSVGRLVGHKIIIMARASELLGISNEVVTWGGEGGDQMARSEGRPQEMA